MLRRNKPPAVPPAIGKFRASLGCVGLDEVKFLFDYGDSWQFDLHLERIEAPGKEDAPIRVIESEGQAPKQNQDWD